MVQTLYIKEHKKDEKTGVPLFNAKKEAIMIQKEIHVIRSWSTDNGKQVFLHADGSYGNKDGSPVKDRSELEDSELIGDDHQRKRALAWWDRFGQKKSEEFYARKDDMLEKMAEATPFTEKISEQDSMLYKRRAIKDRRTVAFSEPSTWFTWFKEKPPWWGSLQIAQDEKWYYKKVDLTEEEAITDEKETDQEDTVVIGQEDTVVIGQEDTVVTASA